MAGEEGAGPVPIDQMDAMDQASMRQAQADQYIDTMSTFFGSAPSPTTQNQDSQAIRAIQDRANAKQQLAQAQSAGTFMRVDPEHVEDLANFFDREAEALEQREFDVLLLNEVEPPGTDPVSQGAANIFAQVGAGGVSAYYENYMKLAKVFHDTANSLRDSAKQTRNSDQDAADNIRRANRG